MSQVVPKSQKSPNQFVFNYQFQFHEYAWFSLICPCKKVQQNERKSAENLTICGINGTPERI